MREAAIKRKDSAIYIDALFSRAKKYLLPAFYLIILIFTSLKTDEFEEVLSYLFPQFKNVIYPGAPPAVLLKDHLFITFVSSAVALLIGGFIGTLILAKPFKPYRDLFIDSANLLQTIPSVAIIGLVVPVMGYGSFPVITALVAYSILPIVLNIVAGIESIPEEIIEAARGLGLSDHFITLKIRIPMALKVIKMAVKNVLVINVAAASLGAIVGAGGFGVPIMAGIHDFNPAYILQGAIPSAALALFLDEVLR